MKFEVKNIKKILLLILMDMLLSFVSLISAMNLIYEQRVPQAVWQGFFSSFLLFMGITILSCCMFDCYKHIWRYAGLTEIINQLKATALVGGVLLALKYLNIFYFSGSIIVAYCIFCFLFMSFFRLSTRLLNRAKVTFKFLKGDNSKNVLIIGGGDPAVQLMRKISENPEYGRRPVAIIDKRQENWDVKLNGVRIVGGDENIARAIKDYKIDEAIIVVSTLSKSKMRELFHICSNAGVPLKVYDSKFQNVNDLDVRDLKPINIEDLLGRNEVVLEKESVESFVKNKVVMVTGGAGSIGSEICRQLISFGCSELVVFDICENMVFDLEGEFKSLFPHVKIDFVIGSIRDTKRLQSVFSEYKPEAVFHAAAHKHVPLMEHSPCEAVKNNIFGTLNVIECCTQNNVKKLICISTDKAVNPANVMGATKKIAEVLVHIYNKKSTTEIAAVRFGNVLGSNGSVIPIFRKQIAEGGPVTLTHKDIKRYFMTIPEASQLVLQAATLSSGGEIFVLEMGEMVKIYDLAVDLIKLSGFEPEKDVEIKITGLRPGEKLFEELSYSDEVKYKTKHEKIFVCGSMDLDENEFLIQLDELKTLADKNDNKGVVDKLFSIVPNQYRKK